MRAITSIADLIQLTKTDVRYKWLVIAGYMAGNRYRSGIDDILKIYYEDALNWMLKWVRNNVSPNNRGRERTCNAMTQHINNEIIHVVNSDGKVLRPEFLAEPISKNS